MLIDWDTIESQREIKTAETISFKACISYADNQKPYLLSVTKDCGVVGGDL